MRQRPFFYKFGNVLFLFFILQIQFAIKGSNAIPGNSHPNSTGQMKQTDTLAVQSSDIDDVSDFDQPTLNTNVHELIIHKDEDTQGILVKNCDNSIDINIDKVSDFDQPTLPTNIPEPIIPKTEDITAIARNKETEEVMLTHVTPIRPGIIHLSSLESSPDSAEQLGYSMMRSALHPKTHSRQSSSANSGGLTPGNDFEWIDENSVLSGSSRLAKILIKNDPILLEKDLKPISFYNLCEYLEASSDIDLCEFELMIICRRIILDYDNFVKTLKDLPLFINTRAANKNAIKINSILYSYLGQSGDEILGSDDEFEQGSGSSRCSKRGTNSTIESSPALSGTTSPNCKSPSPVKYEEPESSVEELSNMTVSEHANMSVMDEINIAQAHVPHVVQPSLKYKGLYLRSHMGMLPGAFIRSSFRTFPASRYSNLYPVPEDIKESKQAEVTSEDDTSINLEEID